MAVGLALYGVSVCQYLFYVAAFPDDKWLLKSVVSLVFALDTFNTIALLSFNRRTLISCRWQTSYACTVEMPWDLSSAFASRFFIAFFVQCFYAHRVWIIGNRNKLLTGVVLVTAMAQLGFGLGCQVLLEVVCSTGLLNTLFISLFSPLNALLSAICDAIITISVFFYLRRLQTGPIRKSIFKNSMWSLFRWYYQDQLVEKYLTAAPGAILGKTYANSMLAVDLEGMVSEVIWVNRTLGDTLGHLSAKG
ncbi:hypothetical protein EDC04DRAFT_91262 [Pisolithus marmoratus]|nr:hypothetical protein EDC04DRAFT_91262 [Pisolithus marmoratus]